MKKFLSTLIALAMAITSVFCVNLTAFAEEYEEMELNKSVDVSVKASEPVVYCFTPEKDGSYIIESNNENSDIPADLTVFDNYNPEADIDTYDDENTIIEPKLYAAENEYNFRNIYTLEAETTYYLEFFIYGEDVDTKADYSAIITENPIESVEFTPAKDFCLIENYDGYYNEDDAYIYNVPSYWAEGNQITITVNGEAHVYTCEASSEGMDEGEFTYQYVDEDGDVLSENYLYYNDTQEESPWTLGVDNYVYIGYFGVSCKVPVKIIENPVESIEFIPANDYVTYENAGGYNVYDEEAEEGYYYYEYPSAYDEGNQLIVKYKNRENAVRYTCVLDEDSGELLFVSDEDVEDILDSEAISVTDDQSVSHWKLGGENYFNVCLYGVPCDVPITIVENPVDSIDFTPVNPYVFYENEGGYYEETEDGEVYIYDYNVFEEGNVITVHYNDKRGEVNYICKEIDDGYFYVNEKDDEDSLDGKYFEHTDEQFETPWMLGTDNYFIITVMGSSVDVPVEIRSREDEKAADDASKAIDAVPAADKVTTKDKAAIEAARKAYNELTAEQKALVPAETLAKLEAAEKALADAQKAEEDAKKAEEDAKKAAEDAKKNTAPANNKPAATTTANKTDFVKLTLSKVKVKKSAKKITVKATLKINGKAVKGKKVTFKVAGIKFTAKTNKKGVAKLVIKGKKLKKLRKKLKVGKKIKVKATYGDKTVTKKFKVKK